MASPSEKHQALFGALVQSYTSQAMVCLGKMANPMTGEQDRDLDQASMLIDMLSMLEARTEGNLTGEESQLLRQSLSMLRLNYVEEKNKPDASGEGEDAGAPAETPDAESPGAEASDAGAAGDSPTGKPGG